MSEANELKGTFQSSVKFILSGLIRKIVVWVAVTTPLLVFARISRAGKVLPIEVIIVPLIGAAIILLSALLLYILALAYPVEVYSEGIQSYSLLGKYDYFEWNEINNVRRKNYSGFGYIEFSSVKSNRKLVIPTWLENFNEFSDMVQELAGPENPLSIFVRENCNSKMKI